MSLKRKNTHNCAYYVTDLEFSVIIHLKITIIGCFVLRCSIESSIFFYFFPLIWVFQVVSNSRYASKCLEGLSFVFLQNAGPLYFDTTTVWGFIGFLSFEAIHNWQDPPIESPKNCFKTVCVIPENAEMSIC